MKQFTLSLNETTQRPVVYLSDWHGYYAMLDTGALHPVWTSNEDILIALGATVLLNRITFGGFGGNAYGKLYQLPYFQIGGLIYPRFPVIAHKMNLPCHMLLSATMFSDLIYEVDNCNHRFNIEVPDSQSIIRNLVIKDENGSLKALCSSGDDTDLSGIEMTTSSVSRRTKG